MADLAVTAANVRELDAVKNDRVTMIADEAITAGQVVYRKTNGRAAKARGNAVGTAKVVGIATAAAGQGDSFKALYRGRMVGHDVSGLNPGVTVYLSAATAGAIDGAAVTGSGNVVATLGTVHVMTDVGATKYILFDIPQNAVPVALS